MPLMLDHEEIFNRLMGYAQTDRLAGSWIFSGLKGIGKMSLAMELAEELVKGNHFNIKVVERSLTETEKKARIKLIADGRELDEGEEAGRSRNPFITVDDIRSIEDFVSTKSLDSTPKVIIIDSGDEMNNNAANALLKTLEEPPANTVIIVISHQPLKLLLTIRSRCRVVKFKPLSEASIRKIIGEAYPDLRGNEEELSTLILLSEGSAGKALEIAGADGLEMYSDILDSMATSRINEKAVKNDMDMAFYLLFTALFRLLQHKMGACRLLPSERLPFSSMDVPLYGLMAMIQEGMEEYNKSQYLYLDKFRIFEGIFFRLEGLKC